MLNVFASYAFKFKASVVKEVSALKIYTHVISICGIKFKALKGLSFIGYQYELIKEYMKQFHALKLLTDIRFRVSKDAEELTDEQEFYTRSRVHIANSPHELEQVLETMAFDIIIDVENKALKGSGLTVTGVSEIKIHIMKFNPSRGSSYVPLPLWIANKKVCITIKNKDTLCLKSSVLCGVLTKCDLPSP